jgi:hypothetical protein
MPEFEINYHRLAEHKSNGSHLEPVEACSFWVRVEPKGTGLSCKFYNVQMAPEGVSSAKGPMIIGFPQAGMCSR